MLYEEIMSRYGWMIYSVGIGTFIIAGAVLLLVTKGSLAYGEKLLANKVTMNATVISKNGKVVVFELESGETKRFKLKLIDALAMDEGETGAVTFSGKRFYHFEKETADGSEEK